MNVQQYETTLIFTPVLSAEEVKKAIQKYMDFLKENGAEIVQEDHWGLRNLAYPIKKKTTGIYHWVEFKVAASLIEKLEINFNRDEDILRYLTVKLDKYSIKYNEDKRNGLIGKKQEEAPAEAEN